LGAFSLVSDRPVLSVGTGRPWREPA
jgi:hypothetical protein